MWLLCSLVATLAWAFEEMYLKIGNDEGEALAEYKTSVCFGLVMAVAGLILWPFSDSGSFWLLITENTKFLIVPVMYALTLAFSIISYRYLNMALIVSLEGVSGALATMVLALWYFAVDKMEEFWEEVTVTDVWATVVIIVAIMVLAVIQNLIHSGQIKQVFQRRNYGWWVFIFPFAYLLGDTFDTVICGVIMNEDLGGDLAPVDYDILYAMMFVVIGLVAWLVMYFRDRVVYNPFAVAERPKLKAAVLEGFGQNAYVFAMAMNPLFAAPLTSAYPILAVFLAHFVLKERMLKIQWLCVALILAAIIVMGITEGLGYLAEGV